MSLHHKLRIKLSSLYDTKKLAEIIANNITFGSIIALEGDLGVGKTALMREIVHTMDHSIDVVSPTFHYVESYIVNNINYLSLRKTSQFTLFHFDLFRFNHQSMWLDLGFNDYINNNDLYFIEWFQKIETVLQVDIKINITLQADNTRDVILMYNNKNIFLNNLM